MQSRFHVRLLNELAAVYGVRGFCYSAGRKWDIYASLCLERRPVILPEMNIIEKTMAGLIKQYELNRSLLSDFEIRKIRDKERTVRLASGLDVSSEDFDKASLETAQEFEDKFLNEMMKLQIAPRKTKDDETGNTKSLRRCLDQRLLFFTQSQIGGQDKWSLPLVKIDKYSSLREAIDQLAIDLFPENQLELRVLGNSPLSVYTYKYGTKNKETLGAFGAKVFILKAYLVSGEPALVDSNKSFYTDFQWLTIDESAKIIPRALWKKIKRSQVIIGVEPWVVNQSLKVIALRNEEAKAGVARVSN